MDIVQFFPFLGAGRFFWEGLCSVPLEGSAGLRRHRGLFLLKTLFHSPKRPLCLLRCFVGFRGDWDSGLYLVQFLQSCSGGSSKSAPAHPVFVYPAPVCLLLILQCALNVYFRSSEAAVSHIWLALRGAETISQPRKGLAVGDRRIENGFEPRPHCLVLAGLSKTFLSLSPLPGAQGLNTVCRESPENCLFSFILVCLPACLC